LLSLLHPARSERRGEESDSAASAATTGLREQHLRRLGVDRWHVVGTRGRGIKVAVLDSGFRGYRSFLGGTLPAKVKAKSFRFDGNLEARDSQHGILCGEVIHALAPEAELLFANWEPDRPEQFLEAVRWATEEGARLISCSVIMPSWSDGEGGGDVHARLSRLLGEGNGTADRLCFASAGNTAQRHWSGRFQGDTTGHHLWKPGVTENPLSPWGSDRVSVELCWQDEASYELAVLDGATGKDVGKSRPSRRTGYGCVSVHFHPESGRTYRTRVRLVSGKPGPFHLVALSSGLEHATQRGSIPFPGDGAEVIAVGAVDEDGQRMSYSSCGPNSRQLKPDLVATVPFPTLVRARPFGGTSAAAPQAAAVAALWWSRHPEWTANQVREALRRTAHDLGVPGPDYETGHGVVRLPWARLALLEAQLHGLRLSEVSTAKPQPAR
jgi:hypothetical protein